MRKMGGIVCAFFTAQDFISSVTLSTDYPEFWDELPAIANAKVAPLLEENARLKEQLGVRDRQVLNRHQNIIPAFRSEIAKLREALEHSNAIMEHAIAIGYLNPGGSTESSFKDAIDKARAALEGKERMKLSKSVQTIYLQKADLQRHRATHATGKIRVVAWKGLTALKQVFDEKPAPKEYKDVWVEYRAVRTFKGGKRKRRRK